MTELEHMKEINSKLSITLGFVVSALQVIAHSPKETWEEKLIILTEKATAMVSDLFPPDVH